ncbi:hypothetical protein [Streptomyces sp. NPDC019937]|uniref:hypothetical protein n=1 Tax=Streptomyces sp. NPDC019937 TaxID=3154787 RepID=UPI003407947C
MTKTVPAGAGAPATGRTAAPHVAAALYVDLEGLRARYECRRPGCPHRLEGPVYSTDLAEDGKPIGVAGLKAFIDGIKTAHLTQYHGSTR